MRAFYQKFSNWNAVRSELSWTHYRLLLRVENQAARDFYAEECLKSNWSTRQLERQKHIDLDGEHFYIDLVFYNYLLKCFVLIDLKTAKLTHQDIGQMDTYVRLYDDKEKGADDNPTIGIILCSEKNEAIVRYSILSDSQQIFASKYQLTLPTKEELENYLQNERRKYEIERI